MILVRLSRAIREQNWFAVVLEFIIVVVGVMLAFQATLWNQDRLDRERADTLMIRLAQDFARLEVQSRSNADRYRDIARSTSRVINAIDSGTDFPEGYSINAFHEDLNQMMQGAAPIQSSTTLQEMLSGGMMHFIEDEALRVALTEFDQQVRRTNEVWPIFMGMQMDYAEVVIHNMRFDDALLADDGDYTLAVNRADLEGMRSDPAVLGSLTLIRRAHLYNHDWQYGLAERAETVSRMLGNAPPDGAAP